jgi:curved DNA-binding protein CbpA
MLLKDYYKVLDIPPTASSLQVKKSFRNLALRFHPDKNPGNAFSEAKFREIQEAYSILSDPEKRADYNYKRWYNRSLGKAWEPFQHDPHSILKASEKLNNYIAGANVFQVDFDALSYHIREILSESNLAILHQFDNKSINQQVITLLLQSSVPLPLHYQLPIVASLQTLAAGDNYSLDMISIYRKQQQRKNKWSRYTALIILVCTLLLCLFIYNISAG